MSSINPYFVEKSLLAAIFNFTAKISFAMKTVPGSRDCFAYLSMLIKSLKILAVKNLFYEIMYEDFLFHS